MAESPDCLQQGVTAGAIGAAVGIVPGFFRVHQEMRNLDLAAKMQRWANLKATTRIMANPMITFGACGLAFAAAQCMSYRNLGREDTLNGVIGGLAAGAVLGLKQGSLASAVGYGSLFAAGSLVTDFYSKIAHPVLDDIAIVGQRPAGSKA